MRVNTIFKCIGHEIQRGLSNVWFCGGILLGVGIGKVCRCLKSVSRCCFAGKKDKIYSKLVDN